MLAGGSPEGAIVAPDRETLVTVVLAPEPATWGQIVAAETASAIAACRAAVDPVIRAPSAEAPEGSAETAREPAVHAVLPVSAAEAAVAGAAVAVADADK